MKEMIKPIFMPHKAPARINNGEIGKPNVGKNNKEKTTPHACCSMNL